MNKSLIRLFLPILILALTVSCSAPGQTTDPDNGTNASSGVPDSSGDAEQQTGNPASTPDPKPEPDPEPQPDPEPAPEPTVATLAVCGDVMSHMPITNDAKQSDGSYDYTRIMQAAEPYVSAADFAVANLETTLAEGNYSGYPSFKSPDALAYDLKDLGFDLLMTSNNHSVDNGYDGIFRTLDVLDEVGMPHVGTSRSEEERDNNIVTADVGGISVAFLAYTYGTNGIPIKSKPYSVNIFNVDYLSNLSDPDEDMLLRDLDAAKELDTDLICVMIHWGVEYKTKQNSYQERMADFLIKNGADLVLGGHPHVLEPMELRTVTDDEGVEHTGFVCYSLGNFISSQNSQYTDTTVVLTLTLERNNVTGESRVTDWSYVPMLMLDREGGKERFELLDCYQGSNETWVQKKLDQAIEDCHSILGPEHDQFLDTVD